MFGKLGAPGEKLVPYKVPVFFLAMHATSAPMYRAARMRYASTLAIVILVRRLRVKMRLVANALRS